MLSFRTVATPGTYWMGPGMREPSNSKMVEMLYILICVVGAMSMCKNIHNNTCQMRYKRTTWQLLLPYSPCHAGRLWIPLGWVPCVVRWLRAVEEDPWWRSPICGAHIPIVQYPCLPSWDTPQSWGTGSASLHTTDADIYLGYSGHEQKGALQHTKP